MPDGLNIDFPEETNLERYLKARCGWEQEPIDGFIGLCRGGYAAFTYFALGQWTGRVKVGKSKDPWRRMGELPSCPNGEPAELVVVLRGEHFETAFHRLWSKWAIGHEWFTGSHEVYTELAWLEHIGPPLAEIDRLNRLSPPLPVSVGT